MTSPDEPSAIQGHERELLARLDDLGIRNEALACAMDQAYGGRDGIEAGPPALFALRASLAEERIALLVCCVELLTRRLASSERRWREAIGRLARHEDVLQLMAAALQELDDPYGFGESLDDRIATDGEGSNRSDEWGRCDEE